MIHDSSFYNRLLAGECDSRWLSSNWATGCYESAHECLLVQPDIFLIKTSGCVCFASPSASWKTWALSSGSAAGIWQLSSDSVVQWDWSGMKGSALQTWLTFYSCFQLVLTYILYLIQGHVTLSNAGHMDQVSCCVKWPSTFFKPLPLCNTTKPVSQSLNVCAWALGVKGMFSVWASECENRKRMETPGLLL